MGVPLIGAYETYERRIKGEYTGRTEGVEVDVADKAMSGIGISPTSSLRQEATIFCKPDAPPGPFVSDCRHSEASAAGVSQLVTAELEVTRAVLNRCSFQVAQEQSLDVIIERQSIHDLLAHFPSCIPVGCGAFEGEDIKHIGFGVRYIERVHNNCAARICIL